MKLILIITILFLASNTYSKGYVSKEQKQICEIMMFSGFMLNSSSSIYAKELKYFDGNTTSGEVIYLSGILLFLSGSVLYNVPIKKHIFLNKNGIGIKCNLNRNGKRIKKIY